MWKQLTVLVFLAAFTALTFNKAVIVFNFYAHQKAITAIYCVNKDKPWLHCNGQCYLGKQLKKEEKKDLQNPERKLENKHEVTAFHFFPTVPVVYGINTKNTCTGLTQTFPAGCVNNIFHPPRTIVSLTS